MSDKQKDKRSWQEKKASVRKQIATSVAISSTVFVVSYLYHPMGIFGVFNVRGNTNAIDPVEGGSENLVFVPNQILRNTTEQFLLHFIAMMTLTLFLEGASMKVIPILCGIFLVARIVYQVGYMASAMSRGYGFASTFLPTVAVYLFCSFRIFQNIIY